MIRKVFFILGVVVLPAFAFADTIYLKSGAKVEGKIVEKTDTAIKVNFQGITLTYYKDEISRISEDAEVVVRTLPAASQLVSPKLTFTPGSPSQSATCFLWEIKSSVGSIVYLLGSIHVAKPEWYPLPRKIEDAFRAADTLVVEVDITDAGKLSQMQMLTLSASAYQAGDTLKNHVSAESYALVKTRCDALELNISQFEIFKPWFVAMAISAMELKLRGFDPEAGIDVHFLNKAQDKKIIELESVDFQVTLFNNFSDAHQDLFLVSTLTDLDNLEKRVDAFYASWVSGNAKVMEQFTFKGLVEHPRFLPIYEKLFFERNLTMASKIEGFLKTKGTYFVVVGSGHMLGDKGILRLLAKKGYRPKQL